MGKLGGKLDDEIFEKIAAGLVYLDTEFRLVEYNRLGLCSLGADETLDLTGSTFFEISDQTNSNYFRTALKDVLNNKRFLKLSGQCIIPHGKQEKCFYDYSINHLDDGILVAATDVTERVSAEEKYKEQKESEVNELNEKLNDYNRLKSEFVANVSHELRTPLTAIIGFAQLMRNSIQKGIDPPLPIGDGLERILKNGKHLLAMIDDVLDLSKLEAGYLEMNAESFNLVKTVTEVFKSLESTAADKSLGYQLEIEDTEFPPVVSDYSRVSQIIRNLISNAIKFTEEGSIKVFLSKASETEWRLKIEDSGIGIAAEYLETVFENFRQVDGSAGRNFGGFGLGLPLSKQLAQLLGGDVMLESKYGTGSKFILKMPFHLSETDPQQ